MKRIAFAITLVLVFAGSALAQTRAEVRPGPFWEGHSLNIGKMNGVEVSIGTMDYVDGICWGRTFSMTNPDGHFTIAPNYSYDIIFTQTDPQEYVSKITGGAWTMMFRLGKYHGMLFGEMTGGTIEWYRDKSGRLLYGNITAELNIKGGTDSFSTVGGPYSYGKFTGTVDYDKEGVPFIVGSVDLMF